LFGAERKYSTLETPIGKSRRWNLHLLKLKHLCCMFESFYALNLRQKDDSSRGNSAYTPKRHKCFFILDTYNQYTLCPYNLNHLKVNTRFIKLALASENALTQ
jgi:hypothetical protein